MPGPLHPRLALSAYVDDRLPTWRRALLGRHLDGCTRCALEVAQIRALRSLLASPSAPEAPSGLRDRLLGIGRDHHGQPGPPVEDAPQDVPDEPAQARRPSDVHGSDPERPGTAAGPPPASRPLAGAVGMVAAGLVVLAAAGAGAVVTGVTTPAPGTSPRASLTTVLPGLLSWAADPGAAATVRPVDNGDRP